MEHIPPYSPELNPIETCWKVTTNNVTKSQYFEKIDEMQETMENLRGCIFLRRILGVTYVAN